NVQSIPLSLPPVFHTPVSPLSDHMRSIWPLEYHHILLQKDLSELLIQILFLPHLSIRAPLHHWCRKPRLAFSSFHDSTVSFLLHTRIHKYSPLFHRPS